MIVMGIIIVALVMLEIATLLLLNVALVDNSYCTRRVGELISAILVKEKRITNLKNLLAAAMDDKASAEALVVDKDKELDELEAALNEANKKIEKQEIDLRTDSIFIERIEKELSEKDKAIDAMKERIKCLEEAEDSQTPEWYKAQYLEMIQAAQNDKALITLLEQANGKYCADLKQRDAELHSATIRIGELSAILKSEGITIGVKEGLTVNGQECPY